MIVMTLGMLVQPVAGATPYDVRVPNAIVGLHNQYVRCQDQNFDIHHVQSMQTFQAEVEHAIAACATQKATLKQQANDVLAASAEFADASVRERAVNEAFDGYDRTRRLMARGGSR